MLESKWSQCNLVYIAKSSLDAHELPNAMKRSTIEENVIIKQSERDNKTHEQLLHGGFKCSF